MVAKKDCHRWRDVMQSVVAAPAGMRVEYVTVEADGARRQWSELVLGIGVFKARLFSPRNSERPIEACGECSRRDYGESDVIAKPMVTHPDQRGALLPADLDEADTEIVGYYAAGQAPSEPEVDAVFERIVERLAMSQPMPQPVPPEDEVAAEVQTF